EVDHQRVDKKWIEGVNYPELKGQKVFVGLPKTDGPYVYDEFHLKKPLAKTFDSQGKHVFVTSRYCFESLKNLSNQAGLWAAGSKTAQQLVQEGYWVNGTSDSL